MPQELLDGRSVADPALPAHWLHSSRIREQCRRGYGPKVGREGVRGRLRVGLEELGDVLEEGWVEGDGE